VRLLISGIGMITSVGHDVVTSCASIRAGIMRAVELEHMPISSSDLSDPEGLVCCPVSPYTDGFGSVARWSIMANKALTDLLSYTVLPEFTDNIFWNKTSIVFALPSLDSANLDFEGIVNSENIMDIFVIPFLNQSELPIDPARCFVVDEDNTAVIKACDLVEQLLSSDEFDHVIVITADSNIEANALSWLALQNRLKTPNNPVGFMPGEAAAALLFETEHAIQQRGKKALARVYAHNVQQEENNLYSEETNTGEALSKSIKTALSAVNMNGAFDGTVFSDLNGEEWRAQEQALAKLNIPRSLVSEKTKEILPVASLGDIGVVNVACSLCILIESTKRGYALSSDALILASAAMGSTGSMLIKAY
jgi:3-oxoacyl-[acyl-carrier-protein] synthase I